MQLNAKQTALISMLVALNVAIGGVVHVIKLPIFLDAIGTIVATLIMGLIPGIIVGALSFLLASVLINPVYIWFIGTQIVIAIFIYIFAQHFMAFKSLNRVIPTGITLGIVAGIVSAPVIVFVFGGVAGSGRDIITAVLISSGQQIYKAVILSGIASEPVDKLLQTLAAFYIVKSLPKRLLSQFNNKILQKNAFL